MDRHMTSLIGTQLKIDFLSHKESHIIKQKPHGEWGSGEIEFRIVFEGLPESIWQFFCDPFWWQ